MTPSFSLDDALFQWARDFTALQECAQSLALLPSTHFFHPVFVILCVDHHHRTLADVLTFHLVSHHQIIDFFGKLSQGFAMFSTVFSPAQSEPVFHAVLACLVRGDALRAVHPRSV